MSGNLKTLNIQILTASCLEKMSKWYDKFIAVNVSVNKAPRALFAFTRTRWCALYTPRRSVEWSMGTEFSEN